jgi:hypothetical protein
MWQNDLLHQSLYGAARGQFSLELHGWHAEQQPGLDLLDRERLFDLMDR